MVQAIEPAVRFYEEPPTHGTEVETPWADIWLSADEWAEAFASPDPGTPHNEARDQVWEELLTILVDKDESDASEEQLRQALERNVALRSALTKAWPMIEAVDLVGDLWTVPAYLRLCAPWLDADEVTRLRREDPRAWTTADLPLLDAARQRLGDPEAAGRRRRHAAAVAAEREEKARVVDHMIEGDDEGVMVMLRQASMQHLLVDESALLDTDPDLLAGPFAHVVVDEAQELTDAEWQMLLVRCPSRSFTIVGDRAQARHGFTESWQDGRAPRAPPGRPRLADHQLPDPAGGHGRGRAGHPGGPPGRERADLHPQHRRPRVHGPHHGPEPDPRRLARRARHRTGCVIAVAPAATARSARHPRVRSLTPELTKGLEFDLVVLVEPEVSAPASKEPSTATSP